jgi:tetratricopeptide (TPR) repeat protein
VRAVADRPEDALAWARLGELWLALGYRERAVEAAETAARLAPDLDRAQTVLGFADLAAFQRKSAKQAFERAIALNSADPQPRFGLGLARIRGGAVGKGRADIEAAVALNPENALYRAYLGKAFFAERRERLAGDQYAIAKELDPKDPTAWLYDAILKQSENQPVDALHNLDQSIRLNDNRAVYRSREELDQDRASRGASLARIYDDLGFQQLGVNEAAQSLSLDPANASAHRFLSDIYTTQPRRDISRSSELLQAQMFQEININPVQPSLTETNLNVFTNGGPARPGLNEFTPLFERNQVQFNASGEVGNNDTKGGEGVVSAIYDQFSISAGQFYYDTDGFRKNFGLEQNISNVFAQVAMTPDLNVQVELRQRQTENGDLEIMFDPNIYSKDLHQDVSQDSARLGLRYSPTPRSDFLVSFIYTDRDEKGKDTLVRPGTGPLILQVTSMRKTRVNQEVPQGELQYVFRHDRINIITGFMGYAADTSRKSKSERVFELPFPPFQFPQPQTETQTDFTILQKTGYGYLNMNFPNNVTWTVGLAYDDYDEDNINEEKVSPKLGVQWNITDDIRFRGAAFRTVKPALVASRTIQPTQVAGFDQFFDDVNGTVADRYAVGLDARVTADIRVGAEASWREVGQPANLEDGSSTTFNSSEENYRTYAYWTPYDNWSVTAEFSYDYFTRKKDPLVIDTPKHVKTLMAPVGVQYFDKSGIFAGLGATFVRQDVKRLQSAPVIANGNNGAEGDDSFVTVDASVGYRFPNRRGLVSLAVNNVFDNNFSYQDNSYREFGEGRPSVSRFIPERTILARVTLNF